MEVEDETSRAISVLVRLLLDPQPDVRRAAARSLAGLAPHSRLALTELQLALRDRDAGVRTAAVKALAVFRRSEIEVPEAEMARLVDDKDASVRAAALGALPPLALEGPMLDKLIDLLADDDVRIRRAAFRMLQIRVQTHRHPFDVARRQRAFAAALAMPDSILRRQARAALRLKNYEPKGEEFLLRFLEHQDPKVRTEAATAFGEMGKAAKKHLPKLRKLLEEPEPRVRDAAERAIAEIEGSGKKGPGTERLKQLQRLR